MSVQLYRKDKDGEIEFKNFDNGSHLSALAADEGWTYNKTGEPDQPEETTDPEPVEVTADSDEGPDADSGDGLDDLTEDELREKAKEAGYPHWHNAGLDKLMAFLSDEDDQDTGSDDTPNEGDVDPA